MTYWLIHGVFGYYGNKSVVFYIAGMCLGGYLIWPLWWLSRRSAPQQQDDMHL